ncbi:L-gulonate 3-dehydrogenase [Mytilus galloprovincialis]|uniref:L-gulonate 3-dehydrogenase n=1 Tax=Mytilus galloprovincialis TaxID=29158 RepID=A0A8B6F4L7_MYTGA|nr:L-gulonate 3-dehydrogenase [Mytilus galloprovincialis]
MDKVAIIGCGMIGRSWAMIFAGSGYKVSIYDTVPKQLEEGLAAIRSDLESLKSAGQLRGTLSVEEQTALIEGTTDLKSCVNNAFYIQECVFEDVELKRQVHSKIDALMSNAAILASSTSCILPARIADQLKHRNRFVVAHPTNPPYYVPLVELLPSPWADDDVLTKTKDLMDKIGQTPITVKKQKDGLVLNRLQNAIFKECFDLFRKGVMTARDIDLVMTEGLGRRYAFLGVLETAYLNADGFDVYSQRYAKPILEVQKTFEPPQPFNDVPVLNQIQEEMVKKTPLDKLPERYQWRDARLSALNTLIKDMNKADASKQ